MDNKREYTYHGTDGVSQTDEEIGYPDLVFSDMETHPDFVITSTMAQGNGTRENEYIEGYDQWGNTVSWKGNITGIYNPVYIEKKYEYDLAGNCTKVTDAKNNATVYQYDELNRLTQAIDALGQIVDYNYDRLGDLKNVTQHDGSTQFTTTNSYERGLLTSKVEPSGLPIKYQYKYNSLGLLYQMTDPNGKTSSNNYYYDGKPATTTVAISSITRYYHPLGGIERYRVTGSGEGYCYNDPLIYVDPTGHDVWNKYGEKIGTAPGLDYTDNSQAATDTYGGGEMGMERKR